MRTIGEILKKARLEKKLEFEEVEKFLKIRKKFLIALEENAWEKLPSLPYIKGFLRNYSAYLGLKPDDMVAIFRRQFQEKEKTRLLPTGLINPLNKPFFYFTPKLTVALLISIFLVLFFGYLFLQYKAYTSLPQLTIERPQEGAILDSDKVIISGKTDNDAVISINNQKIAVSSDGNFSTTITLPPGVNTLLVESISKSGKKTAVNRTIQIQVNE